MEKKNDPSEDPLHVPEPEIRIGRWEHVTIKQQKITLKDRIIFWAVVGGSIAAGTLLFLFFLTLFIYIFLPAAIILVFWNFIQKRKNR